MLITLVCFLKSVSVWRRMFLILIRYVFISGCLLSSQRYTCVLCTFCTKKTFRVLRPCSFTLARHNVCTPFLFAFIPCYHRTTKNCITLWLIVLSRPDKISDLNCHKWFMLNSAIKWNQGNAGGVGSISIIWIGSVYIPLWLFGNVSCVTSREQKHPKNPGRPHSVLSTLKERSGGITAPYTIQHFFGFFFFFLVWHRMCNLDVFTFVLRWNMEWRKRSVQRAPNLLLERDGNC